MGHPFNEGTQKKKQMHFLVRTYYSARKGREAAVNCGRLNEGAHLQSPAAALLDVVQRGNWPPKPCGGAEGKPRVCANARPKDLLCSTNLSWSCLWSKLSR